jgi:HEAT repeat protein
VSKLSTVFVALCSVIGAAAGAQELTTPVLRGAPMRIVGPTVAPSAGVRLHLLRDVSRPARLAPVVPPAAGNVEDPADSLYRLARRAMADENYRTAARLFLELVENYPKSDYAADALYYRAYALYQLGGKRYMSEAKEAIERQLSEYPRAGTRDDSKTLLARIETEMAKRGDSDAYKNLQKKAEGLGDERGCPSDDDDMRVAALQGMMQMDAESALPILRQVLAKRGSCTEGLRKHAVFITSQKQSDEATSLLLDVARSDPSSEVRADAIQWLGQSHSPRAAAALDSIAATSNDEEILDKAIFALSQSHDERSDAALRRIAADERKSVHARTQAIFWFGQSHRDADDMRFLRDLFSRSSSDEIRESIIQAMAQAHTAEGLRWLIDLARDKSISVEARKNALFWAGQNGADLRQLSALYDEMKGQTEIQNQLIFVFSQRRDRESIDKLMDIATSDPDRDLRKQAIFWLGQSKDPRVQKFLLDLINRCASCSFGRSPCSR